MANPFSERLMFLWSLFGQWWIWAALAWSIFSNFTTVRDNFLSAKWQARLSTGGLVGKMPKFSLSVWIIGLLTITLLAALEGAFRVWRSERAHGQTQKQDFDKQISELKARVKKEESDLKGRILATLNGSYSRGTPERVPVIFMLISITNTGAESAVEGWPLAIDGVDGIVHPVMFTQTVELPATGSLPATLIRPEDTIYQKAASPIRTGGIVRGWLIYPLDGVDEVKLTAGTKLTVRFRDAFGNESTATAELTGGKKEGLWFLPDVGMSLPAPKKPFVKGTLEEP